MKSSNEQIGTPKIAAGSIERFHKRTGRTMINQQTLQGNWNEIKGKVLSKWGSLTDADLAVFNGNVGQLLGAIQRKTGESRESIEQFVEQFTVQGAPQSDGPAKRFAPMPSRRLTLPRIRRSTAASMRERYTEARHMVRQRPAQSLAVCFGVGVIPG